MSEETALAVSAPPEPAPPKPTIHLVARNPAEMAVAQKNLLAWFTQKIALCSVEVRELGDAVGEAKKHKWKQSTLIGQHVRAMQRKLFYEKCLEASKAGYTIIPDIPIDVFAIRTAREKPSPNEQSRESEWPNDRPVLPDEPPQILPPGIGDYQNPEQLIRQTHATYKNEAGKDIHRCTVSATAFDAIDFPAIAAVPLVMTATHAAMVARIFDQIGVSPQGSRRNADPLIIGQIFGERRGGPHTRRTASFLIAWHLDVRTL